MSSPDKMSELPLLSELRKQLEMDAKDGILSCLTRLKTDSKCYNQFVKDGGLGILVNLLRYQNWKIVNMSLSILADACITADARGKVRGSKIAHNLVRIIWNAKAGNALHCRACRLIGNLSESSWHVKSLYDMDVVRALSQLLQLKVNIQTDMMAIRAVRNIWTYHPESRYSILNTKVVGSITYLMVDAKERAESSNSKYSEFIEVCLKALYVFLSTFNPCCGVQIRGHSKYSGYKCILQCCAENNKLAIKCLYNLCQIPESRPLLGTLGAVEVLISLIKSNSELSRETLDSLCIFCRDAVNRPRVVAASGLELMLDILKNLENERYHPILLLALIQFVYYEKSIAIMVKNGLLDVLVARLKRMVNEIPPQTENKATSCKRHNYSPPNSRAKLQHININPGRFSLDFQRDYWSPSSSNWISSPRDISPEPFIFGSRYDELAEDNYSPVCSDTDCADYDEDLQEEVESLKSGMSITALDREDSCVDFPDNKAQISAANVYANSWTLALLSRLSYSTSSIDGLADSTTIGPLVDLIRRANNARASRVLMRIVKNGAYLMPLLKQGFVFEAETLHGSEQYTWQLGRLAETGGAIGDITTVLLRGEEAHKLVIAVSIPLLVTSRDLLKSLLKIYGGLQMIFRVLEDRHHSLCDNAVWSISRLASNLGIRPDFADKRQPTSLPTSLPSSASTESESAGILIADSITRLTNGENSAIVTFELDDGTTVNTCRQTLCERSDVFFAMLEGNFSESGKSRVKLRNTSRKGLITLLLAVNRAAIDDQSIESLLDAVLLADKFLMTDISDLLMECSIAKLNHKYLSRAWRWARENSCHELRSCCVKSFLTADMTRNDRVNAFRDLSAGETFYEFLGEVREIINAVLCQR